MADSPQAQGDVPIAPPVSQPPLPREALERLTSLERELAEARAQSAAALAKAEAELQGAARRIDEAEEVRKRTLPPPPVELNEARVRAARLSMELTELRGERDELKRGLESLKSERDAALGKAQALEAAQGAHGARLQVLEEAARSADARTNAAALAAVARATASEEQAAVAKERAEGLEARTMEAVSRAEAAEARAAAEGRLAHDRGQALDKAQGSLGEAEAALTRAAQQSQDHQEALADAQRVLESSQLESRSRADEVAGLRGDLDGRDLQIASLRRELLEQQSFEGKLRAEVETERMQGRAREEALINEVREREARMVAEVQQREGQLVASAQAREAQLLQAAQAREAQLAGEARAASAAVTAERDQLAARVKAMEGVLEQARSHEAALDAELRVVRSEDVQIVEAREQELEEQLESARKDARLAREAGEENLERQGREAARAAELQAVVDSLGRERSALRADAGQMRAQLELMNAVEKRAHQLLQELEELRGENEFLNQEVARYAAAAGKPVAAPPGKA